MNSDSEKIRKGIKEKNIKELDMLEIVGKNNSQKKSPSPRKNTSIILKKSSSKKKSLSSGKNHKLFLKKSSSKKKSSSPKLSPKKGDCIERCNIPLREYQLKAIKYMDSHKSLLIVHGTGTGKTLTALTTSQCFLDKYPNSKIIVVSPASIVKNFEKEMVKYGSSLSNNYEFYSFTKFTSDTKKYGCPDGISDSLFIIDEVHNLRNQGERYEQIYNCAKKAKKVLLLTATPFVNNIHDFIPIVHLLYQNSSALRLAKRSIPNVIKDEAKAFGNLYYMLKGKVSYLQDKDPTYFPTMNIEKVEIEMSNDYYKEYEKSIKNKDFGDTPEAFFNGFRRAVNTIGFENYINQKLRKLYEIVKTGRQTLIFTNWIEDGVKVLKELFDLKDIKYNVISGNIPASKRIGIVNDYNNKKFQVLIITLAGSEGLDLKETRNVIILDPVWNPAMLEQIKGRAVRFNSHAALPLEKRNVNVYLLILKTPKYSYIPSGDEILYSIIASKQKHLINVDKLLMLSSI